MNMNSTLAQFDPIVAEKLKNDLELHEIRKDEYVVIHDWFARMLVVESMLKLYRKGAVDVVGLSVSEDGTVFEPKFEGNAELQKIIKEKENVV
jgi:hypothetical protein